MKRQLFRDLKTRRFKLHFGTRMLAGIGFLSTLIGLYNIFEPGVLAKADFRAVLIVVTLGGIYALFRGWPRPVMETFEAPKVEVEVLEDDLFDRAANLVIGMATTFDTAVPHIINPQSIQGQLLDKIFKKDLVELDRCIEDALKGVPTVGHIAKEGKTSTYPMGTVAPVKYGGRIYYCVAYTKMDEKNRAQGNFEDVWGILAGLWEQVRIHQNGGTLAMPVIGGGMSGMSYQLPAQDAVRLTILSFILASRKGTVCDRLEIVVRPQDVRNLDMLELQDFLRSLRPSK